MQETRFRGTFQPSQSGVLENGRTLGVTLHHWKFGHHCQTLACALRSGAISDVSKVQGVAVLLCLGMWNKQFGGREASIDFLVCEFAGHSNYHRSTNVISYMRVLTES